MLIDREKSNIEVSVVCTCFNQAEYIADALDSFIGQETDFSYEVIVHDDCSTDGTAEIVSDYAARYPHLIVPLFEIENQYSKGTKIYKNLIYPLAKGKYIALCEGDDYWIDSRKLQTQFDFMESHPDFSLCIHNAKVVDYGANLTYLSEANCRNKEKTLSDLIVEGGGLINPTASVFFKKASDCYYCDSYNAPVGDHFILMRLASMGRVMWMSEPMSVYRFGANGSFTERSRQHMSEEYQRQYCQRYINALEQFKDDLNGRCADSFERRIALQKEVAERQVRTARFCDSEGMRFSELRGLSIRNIARALISRELSDKAYSELRRLERLMTKMRQGTLLSASAIDPLPVRPFQ